VKFDVTGAPVDKTTYWEFTVVVTASGGTLPNAPVLAAVTGAAGGGGTAASVTFAPTGNVAANNVQAAIAELDTEKVAKAGDTMTGALNCAAINATGSIASSADLITNSGIVRFPHGYLWDNNSVYRLQGLPLSVDQVYLSSDGSQGIMGQSGSVVIKIGAAVAYILTTADTPVATFSPAADFQLYGANAYKVGGGTWAASSDERIKTVVADYKHGLDEVLKLAPKIYTYKGNDTPGPPKSDKEPVPYRNSTHYNAATDETKFIGLIAQEAEQSMPEMISRREGYIDGEKVTDLRDLDATPLIFALVNAVKKLSADIDILKQQATPKR
jgi:hypothetical protein